MEQEFHNKLSQYADQNNTEQVNILVMRELGSIIVKHKKDFVALLNECGIPASESMPDDQLVDLYTNHLINRKLLLGTAFLVNVHNKSMGADGEQEVSDEGVKTCYDCLVSNFEGENDLQDEDFANAGGVVGAIAGAVGEGAKFGGKIADNQRAKKYGAQDTLQKKLDAKTQITQSILAERQAKIEADKKAKEQKAKTTRTILIVSGVVVGVALIAGAIYLYKKSKK